MIVVNDETHTIAWSGDPIEAIDAVRSLCEPRSLPLRLSLLELESTTAQVEVGAIHSFTSTDAQSLLAYRRRSHGPTDGFSVALVIPTGVGAEFGGEAGDGGPIARLLGSVCDTLIIHPNVVNGSDINELPPNALYVEGSILTRLLAGTLGLRTNRRNRILALIEDRPDHGLETDSVINAVMAAIFSAGIDIAGVIRMPSSLRATITRTPSGRASGSITNLEPTIDAIRGCRLSFDVIGMTTFLAAPQAYADLSSYFHSDSGVNPWGGCEALITHAVSSLTGYQCAHSPLFPGIVDAHLGLVHPRKAAEAISRTYFFSVLKGLARAPAITAPRQASALSAEDVGAVVVPHGVVGLPHLFALAQEIPLIVVQENTTRVRSNACEWLLRQRGVLAVSSYLEAAGLLLALRDGISLRSLKRPALPPPILRTPLPPAGDSSPLPSTVTPKSAASMVRVHTTPPL